MERVEKFDLLDMRFKNGPSSYSVDQGKGKPEERRLEKAVHYPSILRAINVFGIVSEPIYDYLDVTTRFPFMVSKSVNVSANIPRMLLSEHEQR
jgi:hypothetical protein